MDKITAGNPLVRRLIDHFGGRGRAAQALGRTGEAMRLWLRDGIPMSQAIDVEMKSKGLVTAEEVLRETKKMASQ